MSKKKVYFRLFNDYFLKLFYRRRMVFLKNLTPGKISNALKIILSYIRKDIVVKAYPPLIKIDVTPLCQLHCPVCIHSNNGNVPEQNFKSDMKMSLDLFKKLVDEVKNKTIVLSLYHCGEPLLNKNIFDICSYASAKKINTYFTSNLSLKLTDTDIKHLVTCGVDLIIVALDGMTQKTYEKNRIGGKLSLVKNNLERILSLRKKLKQKKPFIEVQSLVFNKNTSEKKSIKEYCKKIGVDKLFFLRGDTNPWHMAYSPRKVPRQKKTFPLCKWLYFSGVVIYNGDIIPCCKFNLEKTYAKDISSSNMGSIKSNKYLEVFNSKEYQNCRKLAASPISKEEDSNIENEYCYLCKYLYY